MAQKWTSVHNKVAGFKTLVTGTVRESWLRHPVCLYFEFWRRGHLVLPWDLRLCRDLCEPHFHTHVPEPRQDPQELLSCCRAQGSCHRNEGSWVSSLPSCTGLPAVPRCGHSYRHGCTLRRVFPAWRVSPSPTGPMQLGKELQQIRTKPLTSPSSISQKIKSLHMPFQIVSFSF